MKKIYVPPGLEPGPPPIAGVVLDHYTTEAIDLKLFSFNITFFYLIFCEIRLVTPDG